MTSSCCGVEIRTDYHYHNELCPKCGEHCEIEDIDDDIENQDWLSGLNEVVKPKEKTYSNN
jgi:transcription initiation factor TFIIIB Brf1 subunit/transcription initiation factor TFIIB